MFSANAINAERGQAHARFFRRRLDVVYFALAIFDILTISAALMLDHIVTTAFERSVHLSQEWSEHLDGLLDLQRLAQQVDAPGNDVFYSHDVAEERARRDAAQAEFTARWRELVADVEAEPDEEYAALLLMLRQADASMQGMVRDSEVIFEEMEAGDVVAAGRGMAIMDRSFGRLIADVEEAIAWVEQIQMGKIADQLEMARGARRMELLIAGAIFFIIIAVVVYGVYVGRVTRENDDKIARSVSDLEQARQRLARYADNVSHELRGPVSKMRVGMEVLLAQDRSTAEYQEGVASSLEECERLSSIIDGLLFLARAENTQAGAGLQRVAIDVPEKLARIADFFGAAAERAGVAIGIDAAPVTLNADRILLQRAITNLVSNALSHTRAGGRIGLSARQTETSVEIGVSDNGEGIPDSEQAFIFDRFRSSAVKPKSDGAGLGLGLPITKAIVELHGGSLMLTSAAGSGTHVVMTFPRA
ncbi:heavy metal sensor histidine kinase [alpha proteobacterium U9-1i]|nr:heavy metal sensor histidine kinase [alpha proteobacterium U9-1i]